jgi:hypothetical protein
VLDFARTGRAAPDHLPTVVWRAGLDLNPLDVTDPADVAWLDALTWPEQTHRRDGCVRRAAIAAADPPILVFGDAITDLPTLAAEAPADATLVVLHTPVLGYLNEPRTGRVRGRGPRPARPLDLEPGGRRLHLQRLPEPPGDELWSVLALDGRPLGMVPATRPTGELARLIRRASWDPAFGPTQENDTANLLRTTRSRTAVTATDGP